MPSNKKNILVVDDEEDILELLRYNLSKEGFVVDCVSSGEEAIEHIKRNPVALMILDLMLPGIDGLEVCRQLKRDDKYYRIPIIMLTAKGEDSDIVAGLELGADDYITKPFRPRVVIARVRSVLRRYKQIEESSKDKIVNIHNIEIHPDRYEVLVGKNPVNLTKTEFTVLHFLAKRPGRVYTRDQIIDKVKGEDYPVTDRSVDVQIVGLRRKLGPYGKYIETVRGIGYRFRE